MRKGFKNVPEENGKKSGTKSGVCEYVELRRNDEKIRKVQSVNKNGTFPPKIRSIEKMGKKWDKIGRL